MMKAILGLYIENSCTVKESFVIFIQYPDRFNSPKDVMWRVCVGGLSYLLFFFFLIACTVLDKSCRIVSKAPFRCIRCIYLERKGTERKGKRANHPLHVLAASGILKVPSAAAIWQLTRRTRKKNPRSTGENNYNNSIHMSFKFWENQHGAIPRWSPIQLYCNSRLTGLNLKFSGERERANAYSIDGKTIPFCPRSVLHVLSE